MTDVFGSAQGQEVSAEPVSSPSTVSSSTPASQSVSRNDAPTTEERRFTQSELNDIVGRAKREAVDRYTRANPPQAQQSQDNYQQQSSISHEDVRRLAGEEAQRLRDQWVNDTQRASQEQEARNIANEFFTKMSAGKDKYDDFEKVTGQIGFQNIPEIVQLANAVDNTHDVMYDLSKNPLKLAALKQLVQMNPNLAYNEMLRLSQSIKDNAASQNGRMSKEPLSQIKPSNTGVDNGVKTAADYKKMFRG